VIGRTGRGRRLKIVVFADDRALRHHGRTKARRLVTVLIQYDTEADAAYFEIADGDIAETVEISDLIMVDVTASGDVIGVEVAAHPSHVKPEVWEHRFQRFPSLDPSLRTALDGVPAG